MDLGYFIQDKLFVLLVSCDRLTIRDFRDLCDIIAFLTFFSFLTFYSTLQFALGLIFDEESSFLLFGSICTHMRIALLILLLVLLPLVPFPHARVC
jgi:hypothetical protein